jgi:hypothetical protein
VVVDLKVPRRNLALGSNAEATQHNVTHKVSYRCEQAAARHQSMCGGCGTGGGICVVFGGSIRSGSRVVGRLLCFFCAYRGEVGRLVYVDDHTDGVGAFAVHVLEQPGP